MFAGSIDRVTRIHSWERRRKIVVGRNIRLGSKRTVSTLRTLQIVANFIVARNRCRTVRRAFVANIICKNTVPESVGFIGELVANFIVRPHVDARKCLISHGCLTATLCALIASAPIFAASRTFTS
jgi:hypothetical protein